MPKNNNLKPVKLPMKLRFGEQQTTVFKNNLEAIRVKLIDNPKDVHNNIINYIPEFCNATWNDEPFPCDDSAYTNRELELYELLKGNRLPTALETISLTFSIEGISLQEVTHILRHRMASFSAECSGDKWWTHKNSLVANSIEQSDNFYKRYQKIVEDAKQLYCDMIDSKQISIMDARYILPRCLETFYFMRMNLKDVIAFIKQRIDRQIQPETDNVIAYQMCLEVCNAIPQLSKIIDFHQPSHYYIKTARTGKATNLYQPNSDSDLFDWNEQDFIYNNKREEMNGTDVNATNKFEQMFNNYCDKLCLHVAAADKIISGEKQYKDLYF